MRIVCNPFEISEDGKIALVSKKLESAFLLVDPFKWSAEGIRQAAKYANPTSIAEERHKQKEKINVAAAALEKQRSLILADPQAFFKKIQNNPQNKDVVAQIDFVQETRRAVATEQKRQMQSAVNGLPAYLREPLLKSPAVIAVCNHLKDYGEATAHYVAISGCLHRKDLQSTLKEEVLHYFDLRMKFSAQEKCRSSAKKILENRKKMGIIQHDFDDTERVPGIKQSILKYARCDRGDELFVSYFIIRDHIQSHQGRCGIRGAQAIREHMDALFSPEYSALCDEFENKLTKMGREESRSNVYTSRTAAYRPATRPRSRTDAPEAGR